MLAIKKLLATRIYVPRSTSTPAERREPLHDDGFPI